MKKNLLFSNKYLIIVTIAIFIIAPVFLIFFIKTDGTIKPSETKYTVKKMDLDFYILERGFARPAKVATIKSSIDSNKARLVWMQEEGAQVAKGDVVARFDDAPIKELLEKVELDYVDRLAQYENAKKLYDLEKQNQKSRLEATKKTVELAKIKLEDVRSGAGRLEKTRLIQTKRKAERSVKLAKDELKDFDMLLSKGHVSKRERDKVAENLRSQEEALKIIISEWENFNKYKYPGMLNEAQLNYSTSVSEYQRVVKISEIELQQKLDLVEVKKRSLIKTEDKLKKVEESLKDCSVLAPISGVLLYTKLPRPEGRRKSRVGDTVWIGQVFMEIPDTSKMIVDTEIREIDVTKVKLGDEVDVRFDAYPKVLFKGKVSQIEKVAKEAKDNEYLRKFRVVIDLERGLENTSNIVHAGMSADVKIYRDRAMGVIAVPDAAIKINDGSYVVKLLSNDAHDANDTNEYKEITPGFSSGGYTTVISGISEGDIVLY